MHVCKCVPGVPGVCREQWSQRIQRKDPYTGHIASVLVRCHDSWTGPVGGVPEVSAAYTGYMAWNVRGCTKINTSARGVSWDLALGVKRIGTRCARCTGVYRVHVVVRAVHRCVTRIESLGFMLVH